MNVRYWIRNPLLLLRRLGYFFYEQRHTTEPFLAPRAIAFLDAALPRSGVGLEWGSGRSTRWFAQRLHRLVSIEHDPKWFAYVRKQLLEAGVANVDARLIPLDHPIEEPTRPVYDPLPSYVAVANEFPGAHFDFIEIDGHYRQACVVAAIPKIKPGGLFVIDDTNWLPLADFGVPGTWPIVHQSMKIDTITTIWRCPD